MVKPKKNGKTHGAHISEHHVVSSTHSKKKASSLPTKWLALAFVIIFGGLGSFFLLYSHADSLTTLYKMTYPGAGTNGVYYTTHESYIKAKQDEGWKLSATYKYVNEAGSEPVHVYWGHQAGTRQNAYVTDLNRIPAGWNVSGAIFDAATSKTVPYGYCRSSASGFALDAPCSTNPAPKPGTQPPAATPPPATVNPAPVNGKKVTVSGRVYNKTTAKGIAGITITTCATPATVKTDTDGKFSFQVVETVGYCVKVASATPAGLSGPVAVNNNPERRSSNEYIGQYAGINDYHNPKINASYQRFTSDRSTDNGFDFSYTSNATSTGNGSVVTTHHDPYGSIDFCSYKNNETVIYGWASDPDSAQGALPNVNLAVQQYVVKAGLKGAPGTPVSNKANFNLKALVNSTAPTDGAAYRDAAINAAISGRHDRTTGVYGYRVAVKGLYQGSYYTMNGTAVNDGQGVNSSLYFNTTHNVDGDRSRAYFENGMIPDSCLAPQPAKGTKLVAVALGTAPAAQAVSSSATPPALYINSNGYFNWTAKNGARYETGQFTVKNANYALNLTGNHLVETFKGKEIWRDPATISYPGQLHAKSAQLLFNDRGQLQVVDPNAKVADFAVWSSALLNGSNDQLTYSMQLSQCGGVYVYQKDSSNLVYGHQVVADNAAQDPACGSDQLGTNNRLSNSTTLYTGMSLKSADGSRLELKPDGTLAAYNKDSHMTWHVTRAQADRLKMTNSGELALYSKNGTALWTSSTQGQGADYATIQNNGYLTLWNNSPKKPIALWENGVNTKSCTAKKYNISYPASGGITCVKPAPVVKTPTGSPKPVTKASTPDPVPCNSIGGGKYNCNFTIPTPVENSKNQRVGQFTVSSQNWITCQLEGSKEISHSSDKSKWWGYTLSDNGTYGWVSAVYAKGGDNDGKFRDVPSCGSKHGKAPTALAKAVASAPRHKKSSGGGSSSSGSNNHQKTTTKSNPNHTCTSKDKDHNCHDNCGGDGQLGWGGASNSRCGCLYKAHASYAPGKEHSACITITHKQGCGSNYACHNHQRDYVGGGSHGTSCDKGSYKAYNGSSLTCVRAYDYATCMASGGAGGQGVDNHHYLTTSPYSGQKIYGKYYYKICKVNGYTYRKG